MHHDQVANSAENPYALAPGPYRREALLNEGIPVTFADFTPEELDALMVDLDEIRRTNGLAARRRRTLRE